MRRAIHAAVSDWQQRIEKRDSRRDAALDKIGQ